MRGLERKLGALCRAAAVYMAKNKLKSESSTDPNDNQRVASKKNKKLPLEENANLSEQVFRTIYLLVVLSIEYYKLVNFLNSSFCFVNFTMQFESTPNLTQDETIPREEGRVKTQVTGTITLDENKIEKILGVSALNYNIIRIHASSLEHLQYSYPMIF